MQKKTIQVEKNKFPNFRGLVYDHPIGVMFGAIVATASFIFLGFQIYINVCQMELVQKELYVLKSDISKNYVAKDEYDKLFKENQELKLLAERGKAEYQKRIEAKIASVEEELKNQINEMRHFVSNPLIFDGGKEALPEKNLGTVRLKAMEDRREMLMDILKKLYDKL